MYRIAISGHRGLPSLTEHLVDQALRAALAERTPGVTGLSCLADGANQIFARAVTDLGGTLEAVIPPNTGRSCRRTPTLATTTCSPAPPLSTACRSPRPRPSPTWPPASSWSMRRTSCTRCGTASPRRRRRGTQVK